MKGDCAYGSHGKVQNRADFGKFMKEVEVRVGLYCHLKKKKKRWRRREG
jgi:hypothetical protein